MNQINNQIKFEVGEQANINYYSIRPFSSEVIDFLNCLSKNLLKNELIRKYNDLAAFAFWCRKSSINKFMIRYNNLDKLIGRGIVFHVAPSNVPTNFAYSLVFGILSGNTNIIRISSKESTQQEIIIQEINHLLKLKDFQILKKMIFIIRFEQNDSIAKDISQISNARVIWGGDKTVEKFRMMKTSPRCHDIYFADRYSISIISTNKLKYLSESEIQFLAKNFYNDVFLFDQNACSSPHLIIWEGDKKSNNDLIDSFWSALYNVLLDQKGEILPIEALEKYSRLCLFATTLPSDASFKYNQNYLYRVMINNLESDIHKYKGKYGFFLEYRTNNLNELTKIVNEKYQTLTYFGLDPLEIKEVLIQNNIAGIDRIVPVGKALEIDLCWDGYDIIHQLTRVISIT